ncbi:hypothetical protein B4U80_14359 [Leptotrombidium deliense]|uniref:Peptidase M12A domain-containing protein n=1 Tax=Leptotrombidium deliense TaxID=299467 RepID=A0A443RXB3_9ACAR|nr:hypothetical protein B4U80_14359 [Leptotrombidium deliense]
MHTLGFMHEQQRADRDYFVKIDESNIEGASRVNFHNEKGYKLNTDPTSEPYIYAMEPIQ